MPKSALNINQFHGGINTGADPRDIADNQLVEAENVMVDSVGRIRTMGSFGNHDSVDANSVTISPGKGLFVFSHDRKEMENSSGAADETKDNYLALADAGGDESVDIWSEDTDNWGAGVIDLGTNAGLQAVFFQADGAVRVCNGNIGTHSTSQWAGYIKRTNFSGLTQEAAYDSWYVRQNAIYTMNVLTFAKDEDTGSYPFDPTPTNSDLDNNVALSVVANKQNSGGMRGYKRYYVSWVWDGVQEGPLQDFGTTDDIWESSTKKYRLWVCPGPGFNARVTGLKVYWKKVDSAHVVYGDAYLLLIADFVNGVKAPDANSWVAWANSGSNGVKNTTMIEFSNEPTARTYRSETGYAEDVESVQARYKTAVVTNRCTYIGNIKAKNKDSGGNEIIMSDAMIKSPINMFDTFPTDRILEVTVRDGDEIIHLEEYSDRLFQFKRNTLHIINISQEIEFLEESLKHKGVSSPCSVCKTELGIAWANIHGVFFYDGSQIRNLLEKNGLNVISPSDWNDFVSAGYADSEGPMVGYVPKNRQLIIAQSSGTAGTGKIYLFDFVTQSWVRSSANKITDAAKTNFQNDWNGDLIYSTASQVMQWNDASAGSTISIKTKDYDFGDPSRNKKIYKVYVSYKGDATAVTCNYNTNGDSDAATGTFYLTGATGDTTGAVNGSNANLPFHTSTVGTDDWVSAELKPSSSINNVKSFQLVFGGTAGSDFEINDISIIYRGKNVK